MAKKPKRRRFAPNWKFRQARREARMSGVELAEAMGVSPGLISQIESGRTRLTQETLISASRALRCSPEDLLPDPQTAASGEPGASEGLSEQDMRLAKAVAEIVLRRLEKPSS